MARKYAINQTRTELVILCPGRSENKYDVMITRFHMPNAKSFATANSYAQLLFSPSPSQNRVPSHPIPITPSISKMENPGPSPPPRFIHNHANISPPCTVKEIPGVIHLLTQSPPSLQRAAIDKYFTIDAAFSHPFCRTWSFPNSRLLVAATYRWYKIMSPQIDLTVQSVGT
jgi:hypothetical protein